VTTAIEHALRHFKHDQSKSGAPSRYRRVTAGVASLGAPDGRSIPGTSVAVGRAQQPRRHESSRSPTYATWRHRRKWHDRQGYRPATPDVRETVRVSSGKDSHPEPSRWTIHGERLIDDTRRLRLSIAHVELPDGVHFEQYVLRMPKAAMTVVLDDARERVVRHLDRGAGAASPPPVV